MDHYDRFYATVERKAVDRPCTWFGLPVTEALPALYKHFKVDSLNGLTIAMDDDISPIEVPYHSPTTDAIVSAFDWQMHGKKIANEERTLTAPGFFETRTDVATLDEFPWPDPSKYIDVEECRKVVAEAAPDRPVLAMMWSCHFQDACAAFGMEQALMNLYEEPEMFRAVIDRITEFYLNANEIFYSATKGKVHAALIGNDFGSQVSLMLKREQIKEFVLPGTKKLVDQAKSYGLKVFHHSCGAIRDLIPDLIEVGVDVIHPIQALATGMEPAGLQRDFGSRVSFCGGVDAQNLLVSGTPKQVREKVLELRRIFPTGLVISPSHEAILPDIAPANVDAMMRAARE